MVNYKLIYFDARGRAEISRLLFAAADVKYEDVRIKKDEWPALKPQMPGGALPVLEIDGKKFSQSRAIAHFLAREFGFHGKNNLESLAVGEVTEIIAEIFTEGVKIAFAPDDQKEGMKEKFKADVLMPKLTQLDSMAKDGHFVGGSLTLADLGFFQLFDTVHRIMHGKAPDPEHKPDKFPNLAKVLCSVAANPRIAKWLKERPDTAM